MLNAQAEINRLLLDAHAAREAGHKEHEQRLLSEARELCAKHNGVFMYGLEVIGPTLGKVFKAGG